MKTNDVARLQIRSLRDRKLPPTAIMIILFINLEMAAACAYYNSATTSSREIRVVNNGDGRRREELFANFLTRLYSTSRPVKILKSRAYSENIYIYIAKIVDQIILS